MKWNVRKVSFSLAAAATLFIAGMLLLHDHRSDRPPKNASTEQLIFYLGVGRGWDAWAIRELVDQASNAEVRAALTAATEDTNPRRALGADIVLFRIGDNPDERFTSILDRLRASDSNLSWAVFADAIRPDDSEYAPEVLDLLSSGSESEKWFAIAVLGKFARNTDVRIALTALLQSEDWRIRERVAASIGTGLTADRGLVQNSDLLTALIVLLGDESRSVRHAACRAMLAYHGNLEVTTALLGVFRNDDAREVRQIALAALYEVAPKAKLYPLALAELVSNDNGMRQKALQVLFTETVLDYWTGLSSLAALALIVVLIRVRLARTQR